ncbi:ATPase [Lujinxingia vulgaris]|uniref:ATPase n=1 Tax=Lujinxingia vulgaris TaxID=2600176 RepID=A0A5C6X912_9DELT|nr:SRPBCC family protein [Lujinxingia vulgaris]TXD35201.1 ATPase [Lujinxingia vulgaris]
MSVDVVTEILIERPLAEVAAYANNFDNAPEWYANIKSVEWVSEPPLQVGSKVAFVATFLKRRLAYTYEFVELSEQRLVMRTAEGLFPMETTYTFETTNPAQTRMTLRNCGEPSGFSKIAAPVMARAMRRANLNDLKAIKAILDAGQTS